jgi:hypothetical protein
VDVLIALALNVCIHVVSSKKCKLAGSAARSQSRSAEQLQDLRWTSSGALQAYAQPPNPKWKGNNL